MSSQHGVWITLKQFFRLDTEEWILFVAASVLITAIAAYRLASNGQIGVDGLDMAAAIRESFNLITSFFESGSAWAHFFLFGFWFIVGSIAYFLAWLGINVAVDFYNDIVISSAFVHPKSFSRSNFWISIASRVLLRFMAGVALLFYCIFWAAAFVPLASNRVQLFLETAGNLQQTIDVVLTFIALVFTLHIAVIVYRIMLLRPAPMY
ncbi:hypothetical protein CR970_04465 [Candidatus Saccharibacteria bacterium]|nr:MAG: hypothetical protein CR970_04465 [Candidatus Saccharibacteria bacterium]